MAKNKTLRLPIWVVPHQSPSLTLSCLRPLTAFQLPVWSQCGQNKLFQAGDYACTLAQPSIAEKKTLRLLTSSVLYFSTSPAVLYSQLLTSFFATYLRTAQIKENWSEKSACSHLSSALYGQTQQKYLRVLTSSSTSLSHCGSQSFRFYTWTDGELSQYKRNYSVGLSEEGTSHNTET